MNFASDNRGPAHPKIIEAIAKANEGYVPSYSGDALTQAFEARIREVFEAPEAAVFLSTTGGATNGLILSTLAQPWEEIYCAHDSHIRHDECNGVEFFTGGTRITYVGTTDRIDPEKLGTAIAGATPHDVHNAQPGPVSITQVTDLGGVYDIAEIASICAVAKDHGLPTHMDGARFANALVALDATPAEMTWKAGIDALSFGGTKNGCLGVEAAIFFDPKWGREFELRRKRAGHLFSKSRFLAAQMGAYLEDDLWLEMATAANRAAGALFDGLRRRGARFMVEPGANLAFVWMPRRFHAKALAAGAIYEVMGDANSGDADEPILSRFVCDWSVGMDGVEAFFTAVDA